MQKHDKMDSTGKGKKCGNDGNSNKTAIESMYRKNEKFCCGATKHNRTFQRVFL